MNNTELVIELFSPDENGYSRWVSKEECVGKYESLYPKNGNHWYRNAGIKKFKFEKNKNKNGEIFWRFNGFNEDNINRNIKQSIKKVLIKEKCVHTGLKNSKNNPIEIDHKNGRYNGIEVIDINNQKITDFQPLTRQSNLQKRSNCNECKLTFKRFDAKELGYSVSFIEGDETYKSDIGCRGCYWFDCIFFKKSLYLKNEY
jgi:hypothetical protein